MISIIIPTYNNASHIREAIDSALSQEGVEKEIIVIDDGSTDETPKVLTEYGDKIRVFRQENQGPCLARNKGLEIAKGEWIKFLDADDLLLPGCLSTQRQQASHPDCDIPVGDVISPRGKALHSYSSGLRLDLATLLTQCPLTSQPLHPRSALEAVGGFRTDAPVPGDETDLHLRLHFAGYRFQYFPCACYSYRNLDTHRVSTEPKNREHFIKRKKFYDGYFTQAQQELQSAPMPQHLCRAFSSLYWDTGRYALRNGQPEMAKEFFTDAEKLTPGFIPGSRNFRTLTRLMGPYKTEVLVRKLLRR
jgi:glycosyltransferase involved in cell wall biosynthesis